MSWNIFKERMVQFGRNQRSVDEGEYAEKLVSEYDQCIKRGFDLVNQIPLQEGNLQPFEDSVKSIFQSQSLNSNQLQLIRLLGNAVTIYWTGGVMASYPVPIIPAPGSLSNIAVISNNVLSPGTWTLDFPLFPTTNENGWVDLFIAAARTHLQTVSGLIQTTSLYPPVGAPAPGFIFWTGYTVP